MLFKCFYAVVYLFWVFYCSPVLTSLNVLINVCQIKRCKTVPNMNLCVADLKILKFSIKNYHSSEKCTQNQWASTKAAVSKPLFQIQSVSQMHCISFIIAWALEIRGTFSGCQIHTIRVHTTEVILWFYISHVWSYLY